jgi:hypothetical protein
MNIRCSLFNANLNSDLCVLARLYFHFSSLAGQKLDFCVAIGLPEKCVTIMKDLMSTEVIKVRLEQRL